MLCVRPKDRMSLSKLLHFATFPCIDINFNLYSWTVTNAGDLTDRKRFRPDDQRREDRQQECQRFDALYGHSLVGAAQDYLLKEELI